MLHLLKFARTVVKTREDVYLEFKTLVNMSALELENWLKNKIAKAPIEETTNPDLVVDKKISRKLNKILGKRKVMLTKGEYECMEKVTLQINKLYELKPTDEELLNNWRCALMNLGHDPLKTPEN